MKSIGIILMCGSSTRFGGNIKKQFVKIHDKYLFQYSFDAYKNSRVNSIVLVAHRGDISFVKQIVGDSITIIEGGNSRGESVKNALLFLKQTGLDDDAKILIHDAARPLITSEMINKMIDELDNTKAVTYASKINDTIAEIDNEEINKYLNRDKTVKIETPQGFHFIDILQCHETVKDENCTDDTSLLSMNGIKTKVIYSPHINMKVTTQNDIILVEALLRRK